MVRALAGILRLLAVLALVGAQTAHAQNWNRTDGTARDVGVGADGSVWVIGTMAGVHGIWRRTNNTWVGIPAAAERIAVDPQGEAWVVDNAQRIFRFDGTTLVQVNRTARDVGVGANGTVWVIGNDPEAGGYGIYRSVDQAANWTKIPGSAVRISVDPQGNAWVVNNANTIFRFDGSQWVQLPGTAKDVGIGADGAAWAIGTDGGIHRWEGSNWARKSGGAAQIAAGPNGVVWVVNDGGEIYQAQVAPATVGLPAGPLIVPPGTSASPVPSVVSGGAAYVPGPVGTSRATCGVPGTALCSGLTASLVRNASIDCPSGSFADLGRSSCWSCASGYQRSIHAVDSAKACQMADSTVQGGYLSATYRGPLCDEGTFHDPIRGGECYSCPDGYKRSAARIDASNACYIPLTERFSGATRGRITIWPHECTGGTFWDGYQGGACYSCPSDYRRTALHITDGKACAQTVGEQWATATLVKKAQCGPGEFFDMRIQGTQNFERGGGCWTCPTATDRTIHPVDGSQACERAPGVSFATASRVAPMTCEFEEIFDPINSDNSNVSSALQEHNRDFPDSLITAKSSGGTCWTCPPGSKRTTNAVYSGTACKTDMVWQSAAYNQPGLFGLRGAEAVALQLVTEGTLLNTIIQGIQQNAQAGTLPANYAQTVWDEIGTRPQDSMVLKMAAFSRVVAAANEPASATPDEIALRDDVIEQIRRFRMFMAQDALDAYEAWKAGASSRRVMHAQSQLQTLVNVGEVPPDFEEITAETILGSLAASGASATAIGLTLSSATVFKKLFPYATRVAWRPSAEVLASFGRTTTTARVAAQAAKVGAAGARTAASISGIALSAGPQIIVTIAIEVLSAAIEQQIDIANAEPKLRAILATATNERVDFGRLMSTADGTTVAQGYWSTLMADPAARPDGTEPPAIPPTYLPAFAQAAAAARTASLP